MYHSKSLKETCFCYIGQRETQIVFCKKSYFVLILTNQQIIAIFFLPKHFSLLQHKLDTSVTLRINLMAVIKLDIFSYIKIIQFLPAALKTVKYNSAEFHTGKVLLIKKKIT